jgi:lipopolysaccharide/colanic/teichoic acid biosynthesis glycosyltransferase
VSRAAEIRAERRRHAALRGGPLSKRLFDVGVALTALVLAAPLMALIALAIVVESPGPVFYRARRVGFRGRPLRMLKFRKMRADARGAPITVRGDARLTRVGAVLTRTRLDELPQFWHVLTGEMSVVGPRPEDPDLVRCRPEDFVHIVRVRPGITGLSQLAFGDERSILPPSDPLGYYVDRLLPHKCTLDRLYATAPSLAADLRILAWTVVAVLFRRPVAVDRATGRCTIRRRPRESTVAAESSMESVAPTA